MFEQHKTFISYKYSEAQELRDKIIRALGPSSQFYQGETSDSPDISDNKTDTIKQKLGKMIWGSSVTIVILSPHMKESKWIDWEISYSLKEVNRDGRTSQTNGIVAVIMKDENGSTDWAYENITGLHKMFNYSKVSRLIYKNVDNRVDMSESDESYITVATEDLFLSMPQLFINKAFEKSLKVDKYNLTKE